MKNIPIKEMTIERLRVELQDARNANALLSRLSPATGPWIRVSERLPEVGKTVCAYTIFGYYRIATFNGKHFFKDNGGCLHARNVTHWAEILPPAEEK